MAGRGRSARIRWSLAAAVALCLAAGLYVATPSWGDDDVGVSLRHGDRTPVLLRLDGELQPVLDLLGPPDAAAPDLNATTAYTWHLRDGGELTVVVAEGALQPIVGIFGHQPGPGRLRVELDGVATLGVTTFADLGVRDEHAILQSTQERDYVIAYTLCRGPFPVVVKLGQVSPDGGGNITSFLLAYADAEPGSAGCPRPGA